VPEFDNANLLDLGFGCIAKRDLLTKVCASLSAASTVHLRMSEPFRSSNALLALKSRTLSRPSAL